MPIKCKKCNNITPQLNQINQEICHICNLVDTFNNRTFSEDNSHDIVICISKKNQQEIINNTYDFFKKYNKIPYPKDIDKDAITLNYPVYIFYLTLNLILNLINNDKNIKFDDIKIFFTNTIDRNIMKIRKIGEKMYQIEKIDIKYHTNKKYLDDKRHDIYMKYYSSINLYKYI